MATAEIEGGQWEGGQKVEPLVTSPPQDRSLHHDDPTRWRASEAGSTRIVPDRRPPARPRRVAPACDHTLLPEVTLDQHPHSIAHPLLYRSRRTCIVSSAADGIHRRFTMSARNRGRNASSQDADEERRLWKEIRERASEAEAMTASFHALLLVWPRVDFFRLAPKRSATRSLQLKPTKPNSSKSTTACHPQTWTTVWRSCIARTSRSARRSNK